MITQPEIRYTDSSDLCIEDMSVDFYKDNYTGNPNDQEILLDNDF